MTAPKVRARGGRTKTASALPEIDRGKLRDALRTIGDEYVFYMLDEAVDLLPPDNLAKLVGQYIQLDRLRAAPQLRVRRSMIQLLARHRTSSVQ